MDQQADDRTSMPMALHPVLAFWAMPYLFAQAWMTSWLGTRKPQNLQNSETGSGQIPVPVPLQEKKDSELFA